MRPTGTGLKHTAEAWGQTDPCVLLRAQVWCISTQNTSSFLSRGNWHILKAKQLGCNIQANQGACGPLLCLAVFCMHCIRPSPNLSRQFESPGEIKNFCCYILKQNNSPQLYTLHLEQLFQSKFLSHSLVKIFIVRQQQDNYRFIINYHPVRSPLGALKENKMENKNRAKFWTDISKVYRWWKRLMLFQKPKHFEKNQRIPKECQLQDW